MKSYSQCPTCDFVRGGHVECGLSRSVDDLDVGTKFQQHVRVVHLTVSGGRVQRRRTLALTRPLWVIETGLAASTN